MQRRITSHLLVILCLTVAGCGDEDNPVDPGPQPGTVVLETHHAVDGEALVLNDMRFQNAAGQTYSVVRFVYYLSDVRLHRSDDVVFGLDRALYHDVADAATLQHRLEQVPAGDYTAITFTWGLNAEKNVRGALPDNTQNNNMFWPEPLGGGYHYSKCEGFYLVAPDSSLTYATHTGRVRRDIDTEDHHHFFSVKLPISIQVDGNTTTLPIMMNVNEWYTGPNPYDFPVDPMIMGDLDRQRLLMENGASAFSIGSISAR